MPAERHDGRPQRKGTLSRAQMVYPLPSAFTAMFIDRTCVLRPRVDRHKWGERVKGQEGPPGLGNSGTNLASGDAFVLAQRRTAVT